MVVTYRTVVPFDPPMKNTINIHTYTHNKYGYVAMHIPCKYIQYVRTLPKFVYVSRYIRAYVCTNENNSHSTLQYTD